MRFSKDSRFVDVGAGNGLTVALFLELGFHDVQAVDLENHLDQEIAGRNVLIVEDIIDSGLTLSYLLKSLRVRRPASLEVAALLVKKGIQRVPLEVKYTGFEIGPEFVIGYGLDYAGKYRNLPYIAVMSEDEIPTQ